MPHKYANFYDGWDIEEDIEITSTWDKIEEPSNPEWDSTKPYVGTGETFALLANLPPGSFSTNLEDEVDRLVDAFEDGTIDGVAMAADEDSEDLIASL